MQKPKPELLSLHLENYQFRELAFTLFFPPVSGLRSALYAPKEATRGLQHVVGGTYDSTLSSEHGGDVKTSSASKIRVRSHVAGA